MKSMKPIHRGALALGLIILELLLRGQVSGNTSLIWLGLLNAFVLVVLGWKQIMSFLVKTGSIDKKIVKTIETFFYNAVRDWGVVLVGGIFIRKIAAWLVGMGSLLDVVGVGIVGGIVCYIVRDELIQGKVYRGTHRLVMRDWLLLASILLAGAVLLRYWAGGPSKFIYAGGVGLLVYTIGLLSQQLSWKEILGNASWILFAGITGLMGVWAGVNWGITWIDDHTIEKVVVKEKEKIVYIEKEAETETESENDAISGDIDDELNNLGETFTGIQNTVDENKEQSATNSSGTVVEKPLDAVVAPIVCSPNDCRWPKEEICVELPKFASCVDEVERAWECDVGYIEQGTSCVLPVVPKKTTGIPQPVIQKTDIVAVPDSFVEIDVGTRIDIGSILNPKPQTSIIDQAQQQAAQKNMTIIEKLQEQSN